MIRKPLATTLIFALSAFLGALVLYNWSIILSPFPIEFREGHSMSSTTLLLNGIKPFTIDTYPQYYNSYGILYSLIAFPFMALFGNHLIIYRILNELFFIAAIASIIFQKKHERQSDVIISLIIACNLYLFFHINSNS